MKSLYFLLVCILFGLRSLGFLAAQQTGFKVAGLSIQAATRLHVQSSLTGLVHPCISPTTIWYHWNNNLHFNAFLFIIIIIINNVVLEAAVYTRLAKFCLAPVCPVYGLDLLRAQTSLLKVQTNLLTKHFPICRKHIQIAGRLSCLLRWQIKYMYKLYWMYSRSRGHAMQYMLKKVLKYK